MFNPMPARTQHVDIVRHQCRVRTDRVQQEHRDDVSVHPTIGNTFKRPVRDVIWRSNDAVIMPTTSGSRSSPPWWVTRP